MPAPAAKSRKPAESMEPKPKASHVAMAACTLPNLAAHKRRSWGAAPNGRPLTSGTGLLGVNCFLRLYTILGRLRQFKALVGGVATG
eukprot:15469981-Alexandrium_andersonii.AAC.1